MPGWQQGLELDRVETNGNYEPGNCLWVTSKENTRSRRVTPVYTFAGTTQSLGDWADRVGIPYRVLKDRVRSKWAIDRTLTTPVRERKSS
jgi:hypothetical protein